ncbi:MAG: deoxyhypusine synthase, partial [Candidatus Hadarchaeales archaeon]
RKIPGVPVRDISLSDVTTVDEIVKKMFEGGGFVAKNLAVATDILEKMVKDKECVKFLSFPACIIATGCRGVVKELVKRKLMDVLITTCGTLDHDLARCWGDYYHGDFSADDRKLKKERIHRLGNVFVPEENYGLSLEEKLQPIFEEIWKERRSIGGKDLIWEIGKRVKNKDSILYWAWKNQIPVFVPGIFDGAVGSQLWMFWQSHRDFSLQMFEDQQDLADIVFGAKRTGALMIGGGISKHHTMWWNQFHGGLDYAVYITTAPEWDGSLSGARVKEGISWGKVKPNARFVTVDGDATVLLPIMVAALLERLKGRRIR